MRLLVYMSTKNGGPPARGPPYPYRCRNHPGHPGRSHRLSAIFALARFFFDSTTFHPCGSQLGKPVFDNFGQQTDDPRQALELEISRVDAQLDQLIRKRKSLRKALNNQFCPVLQLPLEITTEIFTHCLRLPNKEFMTPFHLGHICHAWRDLIWSTPRLWSMVSLNLQCHPNCELVREWLMCSGQQPLLIRLEWEPRYTENQWAQHEEEQDLLDRLEHVMDVLACFLDRWHTIDFCISGVNFNDFTPIIQNALRKPLPLLTSASLYGLQISNDLLRSAPQLDQIQLSHCGLQKYSCPSLKITTVTLRFIPLNECLIFLANSPSLKCCTVIAVRQSQFQSAENSATVVTSLRSLMIDESEDYLSDLLDHLTTPRLRNLSIHSDSIFSSSPTYPFSSIISLITRSACTLYCLSLAGREIQGSSLFECLQMTPSVVELHLSSPSLRNEHLSLLAPYPIADVQVDSSGYLLPRLQLLTYEGQPDIHLVDINTILLARWKRGIEGEVSALKQIHLRIAPGNSTVPALPQHPQRVAGGMYLYIETSNNLGRRRRQRR
jgi:hypothetical protein